MASGGGSTESGEPEFQIAPMIDVLLVLLIFFMSITTAEILKVDSSINLPVSPSAKKHDPEMTKREVIVNARWDTKNSKATFLVGDKTFPTPTEFIDHLRGLLTAKPNQRVLLRGDRMLPANEVERVMNMIGEAGFIDIAFSASNKEKLP